MNRSFTLAIAASGYSAAGGSVKCHLILDTDVDAFNDVYFTAGGPIRANDPAVINQLSVEAFCQVSRQKLGGSFDTP